jgi:hypothetical protein
MKELWNYPLGAYSSALSSTTGWVIVFAATCIVGFYVGACVGYGYLLSPMMTANYLLVSFLSPLVLLAFTCSLVLLVLGVLESSPRFRVVASLFNLALYFAVIAWFAYHWRW